jgi:hypothetical protein
MREQSEMRAGLCVTLVAILAGSVLAGCVRHDPYPSYAAAPAYHYYDPYPRYYGPYYGPRASSGFSITIGKGRHHRHHHDHGHFHRHRW